MPTSRDADTIVVGSGHNALICAAYLAKAGRRILVLERDSVVGGAVSTVERFPGYAVDRGSSAHLMIRHTGIIEDLDLAAHGLHYVDCDPWAFAPAPPGDDRPPIIFRRSLDDTCESIEAACGPRDADNYRRFVACWQPRTARVLAAFGRAPSGPELLRSFWGLPAPDGGSALGREFLMTGDFLLDRWFENERLKAALAWFAAQSGPPLSEPGTAPMVGFAAAMHLIPPGRAIGGSGSLTRALAALIADHGGTVRTAAPVSAIRRIARGLVVRTADGSEFTAPTVVAGCHISTTLDLLEAGGGDPNTIADRRGGIRVGNGIGMVVRIGASELPRYHGIDDPAATATGLQLLVTDRAQLRLAHGAASAGRLPPRPAVLAMSFSAVDPSISPPGKQQLSLWSQWHPYTLADGRRWRGGGAARDLAELEADRIIDEMNLHAPGFADSVEHRYTQSPEDLESELDLRAGNVMHLDMSLDQMMMWRPTADLSGYRVPGTPGLYLTGASTHPGGGVNGASGRTVARLILLDGRRRLMRIPR